MAAARPPGELAGGQAGTGAFLGVHGVFGALGQEIVVGAGPAQGLLQIALGHFFGRSVVRGVAQQLVGGHGMEHVVRTLFAALDLPARDLRDGEQGLGQHVEAQVLAGEIAALDIPVLVDPAAGLDAAAAQARLAAEKAAPVAAARDVVAQRAVDKGLQGEAGRRGLGHVAHLVHRQLPRQHDPGKTIGGQGGQGQGMGDIGQGGQVQLTLETGLPGHDGHADVLDDERVRAHVLGQAHDEPAGLVGLVGLEQGVDGHVGADVFAPGQFGQGGQLGNGKVAGQHARGKVLEAGIHGVGAGGHGGQKRRRIARWG